MTEMNVTEVDWRETIYIDNFELRVGVTENNEWFVASPKPPYFCASSFDGRRDAIKKATRAVNFYNGWNTNEQINVANN